MLYLDTSVVFALFFEDVHTDAITAFLSRTRERVAVSPWVGVELESILNRQRRLGSVTEEQATAVRETYRGSVAGGTFALIPVAAGAFSRAAALLRGDAPLRSADALHLAVADLASATLVTADRQLAAAAGVHDVDSELLRGSPER